MSDRAGQYRCTRCGAEFGMLLEARRIGADVRPPRERFLHHAQRDHDIDEAEAETIRGAALPFDAGTLSLMPGP